MTAPLDQHDQTLVSRVRPPDWVNPEPASRYNLTPGVKRPFARWLAWRR